MKKIEAWNGGPFIKTEDVSPVRPPKRRGDVGHDLASAVDFECLRGMNWIPTGVAIEARYPLWYLITGRSSLHKRGLFCATGVIDAGYQGELFVAVVNLADKCVIKQGEYIAQCIFFDSVVSPRLRPVTEFEKSERGTHGFGSTDK